MTDILRLPCQRVAVFSDIHSNYHAFRACYDDAVAQGAEGFIFLGDYVSDLADPVKTLDLVYEIRSRYPTVCLRGNRERYMLECRQGLCSFAPGSKTGSLLYTYERLRPRDFAFFESLPIYDRIEIVGIPFEIAHAAKADDRFYFVASDDRIGAVFAGMQSPFLLTGHAHRQYIQRSGEKTILNPGSVGVSMGYGPLAQYAMLEFDGQGVHFLLRQIPYDVKAAVRRQFKSDLTALAPYWAVSILYDVITGEEYTMELLRQLEHHGDIYDEDLWHRTAAEMGMKFTVNEILALTDGHLHKC